MALAALTENSPLTPMYSGSNPVISNLHRTFSYEEKMIIKKIEAETGPYENKVSKH